MKYYYLCPWCCCCAQDPGLGLGMFMRLLFCRAVRLPSSLPIAHSILFNELCSAMATRANDTKRILTERLPYSAFMTTNDNVARIWMVRAQNTWIVKLFDIRFCILLVCGCALSDAFNIVFSSGKYEIWRKCNEEIAYKLTPECYRTAIGRMRLRCHAMSMQYAQFIFVSMILIYFAVIFACTAAYITTRLRWSTLMFDGVSVALNISSFGQFTCGFGCLHSLFAMSGLKHFHNSCIECHGRRRA